MLLIRGEKRCLAHTQILAAPRIKAVLSNSNFINVFVSLTPPRHTAGYGHRLGHSLYFGTLAELGINVGGGFYPSISTCAHSRVVGMMAAQWSPW